VSEPPPAITPLSSNLIPTDPSSVSGGQANTGGGGGNRQTTADGDTSSKSNGGNGPGTTGQSSVGGNGPPTTRQSSTTTTTQGPPLAWKKDEIGVGEVGWGQVRFANFLDDCTSDHCTRGPYTLCSGLLCRFEPRFVITAREPYAGWKFARWVGACSSKSPKCVVNFSRLRPSRIGVRYTWLHAEFIPIGPGITRKNPVPLGKIGTVSGDFKVTVKSIEPNVQLDPGPPPSPGAEYFGAKLSVTYTGGGSKSFSGGAAQVIGSHNSPYSMPDDRCPDEWPWPVTRLDTPTVLYSGQSVTGYLCWQVAKNDAKSLDLYFGSGRLNFPGTIWFALHH